MSPRPPVARMPDPIPDGLTSEQLALHVLGRELLHAVMRASREDEQKLRRALKEFRRILDEGVPQ